MGDVAHFDRVKVSDGEVAFSRLRDRIEGRISAINADAIVGRDRKVNITGTARVGDHPTKFDITESESLLFGTGFGVGTDIETGPDGNLYVVSLSDGKVYESHYFQLESDDPRDAWEHVVRGDGDDAGLVFVCRFVPLEPPPQLAGRQAEFLDAL